MQKLVVGFRDFFFVCRVGIMADLSVPGTSAGKRRKIAVKNDKKLTDDELLEFLNASDSDEDPFHESDSDDNYVLNEEASDSEEDVNDATGNVSPASVFPQVNNDPVWIDVPHTLPHNFNFNSHVGLLVQPTGNEPMDYFNLLIDDSFYTNIVNQTNIYAEEIFLEGVLEHSRITQWKDVDVPELKIFFGLVLHMGTIQISRLQDYWRKDPLFDFQCFSRHMSRNRFLLIMRALHFAKNSPVSAADDRLFKIRPVIKYFNDKMLEIYGPGKHLSLDESLVLWRGRLSFRQYIKNKRHRYGVKLYILTESSGITLKVLVYAGANDECSGKGHTTKVVLHLLEERLNKGHAVYMDNYYNSYELSRELLKCNTYCTGTIDKKRKNNSHDVMVTKLRKGESITKYADGVVIGKWRDKRDVHFISTEFLGKFVHTTNRRGVEKEKPDAIIAYNKHMLGVDRKDQMLSYNSSDRKTLRWYKKIGIYFLQLALLNSHYLYNKYSGNRKMSYHDYRLEIISNLLGTKNIQKQAKPKAAEHLPTLLPRNASGRIARKDCRMCARAKKRVMTNYTCVECVGNPGLCLNNCFKEWHQ